MGRKSQEIKILDIIRKTPGAKIHDLATQSGADPEAVFEILNDPDFRSYIKQTEGAHLSQLRLLHQIAMDAITECLEGEKDPNKVQDLAFKLLKYSTDSIVRISELNAETGATQDGNITINQMLGRPDPFAKGK